MIIKKLRYSKQSRSLSRNNSRRDGYSRINRHDSSANKTRIRGNVSQVLSKYLLLAKNALSSGDRIQAEYYYQHADHFSRIISSSESIQFNTDKNKEIDKNINTEAKEDKTNDSQIDSVLKDENNDVDKSLESVGFLSNPNNKET